MVGAPLRAEAFFAQVKLPPEMHTLVWPNGADFAPEFLQEKLLVAAWSEDRALFRVESA